VRRTSVVVLLLVSSGAAAALGFACGFDGLGTGPVPIVDSGVPVQTEASLPPPNDSSTDAPVDAPPPPSLCPTTGVKGPELVLVTFDGGATTCIDSTEVTNAQYAEFVAAADGGEPSLDGGVPATCTPFGSANPVAPTPGEAGAPIQGVSWCQAYAYCKFAGKRLCTNEWRRVCSREGTRSFPYGTTLDPTACNVGDAGGAVESEVKSFTKCVGGYPGVFDMVGNVSEWVDDCAGGVCASVGGGFYTARPDAATCATSDTYGVKASFPGLGFRCCR